MLHITIIAVGKLKERFWEQACEEYLKRLQAYARIKVVELPDVDPAKAGGETQALAREGKAILSALPKDVNAILLDIKGAQLTSEAFASKLEESSVQGANSLAFIIGGSLGVSEEVRQRASARISFGKITLPHNLARVILLEQLYRAFKIIKGEPYHK